MPSPRARRKRGATLFLRGRVYGPGLRGAAVVLASDDDGYEEGTGQKGMRFSANVSILFKEVPFLERFGRAAATGFSTGEFWWPPTKTPRRSRRPLRTQTSRLRS